MLEAAADSKSTFILTATPNRTGPITSADHIDSDGDIIKNPASAPIAEAQMPVEIRRLMQVLSVASPLFTT
jgi:hypothetical protein